MKTKLINRAIVVAIMLGITGGGIFFLPWAEAKKIATAEIKQESQSQINPFNFIKLTGKSAIVMNADTGEIIFQKNAEEQMPLASITKVMTALVADEILTDDKEIVVDYEALKEGSNAGLSASRWHFKDLIDFSLVTSSNGGARAIAAASGYSFGTDFIKKMNQKAVSIGLDDTYFINPTGLDVGGPYGGSYGTVNDIAKLFQYVLKTKPDLLSATRQSTITRTAIGGYLYSGHNTNEIVDVIPGILASKTGFTDNAGGNLAIAFDAGLREPYIIVVLGSTKAERFNDVKKLVDTTIDWLAVQS